MRISARPAAATTAPIAFRRASRYGFYLTLSKALKMPACEDCCYFSARPDRCRRFPPTVSMLTTTSGSSAYTHWPAVTKSDWCGEFKSKVEPASIYDRPEVCNVPTP
jgi:hypothetical protein